MLITITCPFVLRDYADMVHFTVTLTFSAHTNTPMCSCRMPIAKVCVTISTDMDMGSSSCMVMILALLCDHACVQFHLDIIYYVVYSPFHILNPSSVPFYSVPWNNPDLSVHKEGDVLEHLPWIGFFLEHKGTSSDRALQNPPCSNDITFLKNGLWVSVPKFAFAW